MKWLKKLKYWYKRRLFIERAGIRGWREAGRIFKETEQKVKHELEEDRMHVCAWQRQLVPGSQITLSDVGVCRVVKTGLPPLVLESKLLNFVLAGAVLKAGRDETWMGQAYSFPVDDTKLVVVLRAVDGKICELLLPDEWERVRNIKSVTAESNA